MVTRGLTAKQLQFGLSPRLIQLTKKNRKMLGIEHRKFEEETLDDCYIENEPWIDYFETYYLAEYNSFSKPFVVTKRIEFRTIEGRKRKTGFFYQIVYKEKGKNAPSPVRAYVTDVNKKIDEAFGGKQPLIVHLKKHLEFKIQEKHVESLRNYIKAK